MKGKLKRITCFLSLCLIATTVLSQKNKSDSIFFKISLPVKNVKQKDDLKLKVVIVNMSEDTLRVYSELIEGYTSDIFTNLNLIIERKIQGIFKTYNKRSLYSKVPTNDTTDLINKIALPPKDSIVNYYHLDNVYLFEVGDYRIRCIYRNDILKKDKILSDWKYFRVDKKIYVSKYYE
jgi:hypothetical protein